MANDDGPVNLAALYLRNRAGMLRAARSILRNDHDAEDAVSAAMVKVTARLADGHLPNDPDAYLVQAVRNAALDNLRKSTRRRGQQPAEPAAGVPHPRPRRRTDQDLHASVADTSSDLSDLLVDQQRSTEVQAALQRTLDKLAPRERTMLVLLVEGRTRVDIGAGFGLTGQRVGQLLKEPIVELLTELGIDAPARTRRNARGDRS